MGTRSIESTRPGKGPPARRRPAVGPGTPAPTRTRRTRCCRCITSSSTPIARPAVRGADPRCSAIGVPDEAAASAAAVPASASAGATASAGQDQERADSVASRSWPLDTQTACHGRVAGDSAKISEKSSDIGRCIARLGLRAARCSVPVSRASRMDSGPRCGSRLAAPWRPGSGRPATTTRSGRGTSIRPTCRRRRCCRTTPTRFRTVEINYTFYRMPTAKAVDGWLAATPDTLPLHAEGAEAHHPRSPPEGRRRSRPRLLRPGRRARRPAGDAAVPAAAEPEVQPRRLRRVPRHAAAEGARGLRVPHASWLDDAVYERLRARNLALCIADTGDRTTPIVETADYGYFRLRDEGYQAADIARWAARSPTHAPRWREAFVYFKHEDEGKGPEFGAGAREGPRAVRCRR